MALNGMLPDSSLRETVIGGRLAKSAARDADSLALAFASKFYRSLRATDTYRSLQGQRDVYASKGPGLAAFPGTSNHGWGTAVDVASNINRFGSVEHRWMQENAGRYGWEHPFWARQGGGREEAWHWEHVRRGRVRHTINRPRGSSLGLGSSGAEVRQLQRDLNKIYAKRGIELTVDGDFGMGTYALVRRFQRARGYFLRNGVVGKWTKSAIARAVKAA